MILSTLSSPPSPNSINIISSSCDDDDDGDAIVVDYCCCSPNHLQAQRFNNIAATCMLEHGQQSKNDYEKALSILETALRICEKEKDQEDVHEHFYEVCSCHSCSIDRLLSVSSKCESDNNDMHDDNDNDGTTIYQNPISVQEGHNMGSTLTHIIAFNLALVHHLRFVRANNNKDTIDISINKALQCYELAYECNMLDTCSDRFDEMICNNLSHIYRYQEQTEEERHFQQHQQQQQTMLEQEKETLHHLQEPISVSDDEDDNDDDVSNSSLDDTDDLSDLESYNHHVVEPEDYVQERKQRKRKHTHNLTTTQRQRNKLLHDVDVDDLDQYHTVIDTYSVSHNKCSHGSGEERDIIQGEGGLAY